MKKNVLIIFAVLFVVFSISCKREELPKVDDSSALRLKTDNTAYIQGLINACPTNGTLTITPGTYYINQDVSVKPHSNMTLNLTGVTLRANISTSTNLTAVIRLEQSGGCNNVTINGGTIIGDRLLTTLGGNETAFGIAIFGSDYVTINGTTAKECKADGINVNYDSDYATIDGCTLDHNRRQGLSNSGGDYMIVQNCLIKNTEGTAPQFGIDVEPNSGYTSTNCQILNNEFLGNRRGGIVISQSSNGTVSGVTISGNTIHDNGLTAAGSGYCYGIQLNGVTGVTVTGNSIHNNARDGIMLSETQGIKAYGNIIRNNYIYDNGNPTIGSSGISCFAAQNNTITGNTVAGNISTQIGGTDLALNTVSGNITLRTWAIARYKLGSTSGTSVSDASGNSHTGTITGAAYSWGAGGITGRSYYYNALTINSGNEKTTYVSVPDHAAFDFGTGAFTVAFWVKKMHATASYSDYWGVSKWNTGAATGLNEWAIQLSGSGGADVPTFVIEKSPSPYTNYTVAAGTTSILNAWHHVAGVRNGVYLYIYVDGVLRGTSAAMPLNTSVNNIGRMLYIGGAAAHNSRPNAVFDNVRIYNAALTTAQVLELYNYTGDN